MAQQASERLALNREKLKEYAESAARRQRRRTIREKLRRGGLPLDRPDVVDGALGRGQICAGCDQSTSASEMVMAVKVVNSEALVYLHADCFQIWYSLRGLTAV